MKALRLFFTFALAGVAVQAAPVAAQSVTIDTGALSGTTESGVSVFRGIPFAAPPVGDLRWKAPQAPATWTGVRAATSFGAACEQERRPDFWAPQGAVSEDCLFLNVWTPKTKGKLPVMVFIHGGSFSFGAAGVPFYDGAKLAQRGVVIVTVNYRLGRFGFFAHPALSQEDPEGRLGNYGIMDQIAALEWVKRNVAKFGGDAGNVTIFGESAGAGAVQILMSSPASKGLFHKAISESGAGNSVLFPIRGGAVNAEAVGKAWAEGLGHKDATPAQLRALPVSDLLKNSRSFPFIDGKVVTRSPGEPFYNKQAARIPLMIGGNSNEASLGIPEAVVKPALGAVWPELLAGYAARPDRKAERAAIELSAEAGFLLPSYALADWHAAAGNKTWAYYFDQMPANLRATAPGTDHGAELEYVFGNQIAAHEWDDQDRSVAKLTGDYWVRFARTGNPNGGGAPKWPAVTSGPTAHLYIGGKTQAATLTPLREKAKAAGMADAIKKWPAPKP